MTVSVMTNIETHTAPISANVDARGLDCPLPLLRAKKALNSVNVGELVFVIASDPASEKDFHAFIELTHHELVQFKHINNANDETEFQYLIRKGDPA